MISTHMPLTAPEINDEETVWKNSTFLPGLHSRPGPAEVITFSSNFFYLQFENLMDCFKLYP